jgi:hypothetical protein
VKYTTYARPSRGSPAGERGCFRRVEKVFGVNVSKRERRRIGDLDRTGEATAGDDQLAGGLIAAAMAANASNGTRDRRSAVISIPTRKGTLSAYPARLTLVAAFNDEPEP